MKEYKDEHLIAFLQEYIQINTAHPHPNYTLVCNFFKNHAEQDGLECNIVTLANNKPVIIITLPGTDPNVPSLILNHHMDVVPALNHDQWITAPFEGSIYNDMIIGRGAQDCKGLGAIHYSALRSLKKNNVSLTKTIYLTIVPDEEIGGFSGTKEFISTDFFKSMNASFILDEGIASGKKDTIAIKVTERKPLQIKITMQGKLSHGSKLNCFNAIHELIVLLQKFIHIHEAEQKKSVSTTPDGLLLSTNITSLSAGVHENNQTTLNIVPDYASATIDIRIPPHIATQEIIDMVDTIIQSYPHATYIILAGVFDKAHKAYSNFNQNILYNSLVKSIEECGLSVEPHYFEASSDLRFYKELGLDGFGFSPFTCQDNMHGTNESLPLLDLMQAKNIMLKFLKNFCL